MDLSDTVIGYKMYVEMARPLLSGQEIAASGMTKELDRAGKALDLALAGRSVALVSGGDPGVYAMAAVVFELVEKRNLTLGADQGGLEIEVVPGVPAVTASAALLGAPLSHDFCCISLSDRLTPWELIEKRLALAAEADFVIALYNPRSKGRDWQLGRALEIVGANRAAQTPVGIVSRAMRQGQRVELVRLSEAARAEVDMQTLVIIGNSQTFIHGDRMITPRGYLAKYDK